MLLAGHTRAALLGPDRAITLAAFEKLVAEHEIHYSVAGGGFGGTTVYDLTSRAG